MRLTIGLIVLSLLCASSLYALDAKNLVFYFSFNEGAGTVAKDASANKNNGEIKGKIDWVAGKYGKAIKFNETDPASMVSVKANKTLDVTDAMSYGAWVYVDVMMPDGSCALITKADTYMIHMSDWSKKGVEMEPLLWPFDKWQSEISTPIQVKEWHHVMGIFDGKELKTYLDGVLKGKRAFASKIAVTTNDLVIGKDNRACCNTRRNGITVDDAVMFNRALTEAEIKEMQLGNLTSVSPQGSSATLWGDIKQ